MKPLRPRALGLGLIGLMVGAACGELPGASVPGQRFVQHADELRHADPWF